MFSRFLSLAKFTILLSFLVWLFASGFSIFAEETEELEGQLDETRSEIEQTAKEKEEKQTKFEEAKKSEQAAQGSLNFLHANLSSASDVLEQTLQALSEKKTEIQNTETKLLEKIAEFNHQKELLKEGVRALYTSHFFDEWEIFLASRTFQDASKTLIYREFVLEEYKRRIGELNQRIEEIEEAKNKLGVEKEILESQKNELERQRRNLEGEIVQTQKVITAAQAQQTELMQQLIGLETQLDQLTQKEREILQRKAAAALASTTVGEEEIKGKMIEEDPPRDGQLYFSFWTYGYPHRVGVNQYGAYGRAKAGQNFEQILKAYYQGVEIASFSSPETIEIQEQGGGTQRINFEEDYLLGIAEMPSCWGKPENNGLEALKTQAIAARTYALNYTNLSTRPICTDQRCQVYVGKSKIEGLCGEYWKQAVEETRDLVILYGGEPISAWYASTAGGFTLSSKEVWGSARPYALGINDLDELSFPYDGPKWGNSPWYHKCWGDGPWLSKSLVEDLLNTSLLPERFDEYLPEASKDGYSSEEVLEKLRGEGITPIQGLTALEVLGEEGKSTTLIRAYFQDKAVEIDAGRFRKVFNLRSPGTNAIWTSRFDIFSSQD